MNTHRQAAAIVGVLFIIATVTAILGLLLYQPILNGPDYLVNGFEKSNQVILGAVMELILVLSAVGTAVGLFPFVRKYSESIALGYLFFRFLEAVLIMVGIVSVLSLLTVSREFVTAAASNASAFQTSGTLLKAVHDWTFILGPHLFLGVNTMMYSYLLYQSRLVPRWIAGLGLFGSTLIFIVALFEMFGAIQPTWVFPLAMPVAIYEMVLAGWLIAKGFNSSAIAAIAAIAARPAKTETNELVSAA
jgi:Domain of unknown function (DUF4386)